MTVARREPVAIVGIGCRLPGGVSDPTDLWRLLREGTDAITPIPHDRFDLDDLDDLYDAEPATPGRIMSRFGGFVQGLDQLDAGFFELAPRQAERLDPQHRLLLETTYEAIDDAGLQRESLAGTSAGVYVGMWTNEYDARMFADRERINFHSTTGTGRYAASGRISYLLDVLGPSVTVDTACSSSLAAIHLACQGLQLGECDVALAGGVNAIVEPFITIAYSQSHMMAPDGRCKFGDASANGYVRSDGAVMLTLKSLSSARAAGDRIYAVIRGSAVTNDGRTSGLLGRPGQRGQEVMLRQAYAAAGVDPATVQYVECHGTGTAAGDPVELGALATVVGAGSGRREELLVGSIKTNIGHTEGAAGAAGVVKVALALQHGEIPASLHFNDPNPAIAWDRLGVRINTAHQPWPASDGPRRGGVSAYGIAGTNAHVVLEAAPAGEHVTPVRPPVGRAHVLTVSASGPAALAALAERYANQLDLHPATVDDLCATAATRRSHLADRIAVVGSDAPELAAALRARAANVDAGRNSRWTGAPRVVFVFPGQGSQWPGMARELLAVEPVFAEALGEIDSAISAEAGWSPIHMLTAEPADPRLDDIDVVQPLLFAVEVALARLWMSWGVTPAAVVGHSMGEAAAAHIAGALDLTDAVAVICRRSALLRRISGAGAMLLVDLPAGDAEALIADRREQLSVAVANSPRSTVIAGAASAIDEVMSLLQADDVFCRKVNVDVASHSPQVEPLLIDLRAQLAHLRPQSAGVDFRSTVTGERHDGSDLDAGYWADNLRCQVRFGDAVASLAADGPTVFVEVSPHPVLATAVEEVLHGSVSEGVAVVSLRRQQPESAAVLAGLAAAYEAGVTVDWQAVTGTPGSHVALPAYPWQRERHWYEPPPATGARTTTRPIADMIHALEWRAASSADLARNTDIERWIVVGADTGVAELLAARLSATGAACEIAAVAAEMLVEHDAQRVGVVVFGAGGSADADPAAIAGRQVDQVSDTLALASRLDANEASGAIFMVTSGAWPVGGSTAPGFADATLWGVGRAIAEELPHIWGGCIDLDPDAPTDRQAAELAHELTHVAATGAEGEVALRAGGRWVQRLVPGDPVAVRPLDFGAGSVVITGGFGAVGRQVAEWAITHGARHLVMLGRTDLGERSTWQMVDPESPVGERIAIVGALEALGATVAVGAVDTGDPVALRDVLARTLQGLPAVRSVFHAAAEFGGDLIGETTRQSVVDQLQAKVAGALVFDELPDLDHLVLFSSIAGTMPVPGQAAYSAANCLLDALAQHRMAAGHRALSVNWGYWEGSDTDAERTKKGTANLLARSRGMIGLEAHEGLEAMARLLRSDIAEAVVVPVDWKRLAAHGSGSVAGLLADRGPGGEVTTATRPTSTESMLDRLCAADRSERVDVAEFEVRRVVGSVLRVAPDRIDAAAPFGALGLDSLLSVELRNTLERELNRKLSATVAWNYPTVRELAAYVLELAVGKPTSAAERGTQPLDGATASSVAELSDDEALAALMGDA